MPRYFLEVAYKGTAYSGFQSQQNANTVQAEIEKAFGILQKDKIVLTGSSRTDAGVHAVQNFFHFDTGVAVGQWRGIEGETQVVYKLNAILPGDIVIKSLNLVAEDAHCRFDAISREYNYYIYRLKDPFLNDRAFFFPYKLDMEKMQEAANIIKEYSDFTSFSKRNTQVKTFICRVAESNWFWDKHNCLVYHVKGNRFLRGMVRALTGTMLKVGRGKLTLDEFRKIIEAKDCTKASFAVPPHGLFLLAVEYRGKGNN
ncbi:MAG: tRNA pseudouridine(38-40) synthase TruA [Bacteroidota bacterium]